MVGLIRKAWEFFPGSIGHMHKTYRKSRHKKNKRDEKQRQAEKKHYRAVGRSQEKYYKDQKKYNKNLDINEQRQNQRMEDYYDKYGDESFQQHQALTNPQHSLLKSLAKKGSKNLKNQLKPKDIRDIGKDKGFRKGQRGLQDLLKDPGISNIEKNKYYKHGGNSIRDLLENPGITDIQGMEGYQQGQQGLNELLDQSPEAFQRYAKPYKDYFQQEITPELIGRFGGGGKNSSALNNAFASAGQRLTNQIEQSRQGLIPEALRQQLQYSQAPLQGEEARGRLIGQSAESALRFAGAPWEGQKASADIRGRAAQNLLPFSTDRAKIQALQAENQRSQNSFGLDQQKTALGVNPYDRIHRGPQAPTGYNITGGPSPVQPFAGLAPYPQRETKPNFYQQAYGAFLPAAATAAGAAVGGPVGAAAGGAIGSGISSLFGGSGGGGVQPQSTSWGSNQFGQRMAG